MQISYGVLFYRLLNSGNLRTEQKQIVKPIITKMSYQVQKDQSRKFCPDNSIVVLNKNKIMKNEIEN